MGNPSQSQTAGATATNARSGGAALLVLDGTGKILLADAAARALWRAGGAELIGEHFSALFAFEVTSKDSRWLEAQWDVLVSAAVTAPLRLVAQPKDGPRLAVSVRLEAATGASGPVCFAFVQVEGAPGATAADPLALLAERSPVGVFDLNFKAGTCYYSPAWAKQLGYAEQELSPTFETWRSLLHAEDSAAAPDRVGTKFFNGLRSFSVEYRLRHKKGHYVWLHGIGLQVFGPDGDLERALSINTWTGFSKKASSLVKRISWPGVKFRCMKCSKMLMIFNFYANVACMCAAKLHNIMFFKKASYPPHSLESPYYQVGLNLQGSLNLSTLFFKLLYSVLPSIVILAFNIKVNLQFVTNFQLAFIDLISPD